jgi:hypothetical protein
MSTYDETPEEGTEEEAPETTPAPSNFPLPEQPAEAEPEQPAPPEDDDDG